MSISDGTHNDVKRSNSITIFELELFTATGFYNCI